MGSGGVGVRVLTAEAQLKQHSM